MGKKNSVEPDHMPQNVASDQYLHYHSYEPAHEKNLQMACAPSESTPEPTP